MSNEKNTLIKVSNLKQYFPIGKKQVGKPQAFVRANDGISLEIKEGETFGLVGESDVVNLHLVEHFFSYIIRRLDVPYTTDVQ